MLFIRVMAGKEWRYIIYVCTVAHHNFLYNPLYITIHIWVGGTSPPHAAPPDLSPPFEDASEPADRDRKGHKTEPCSAGIQRDNNQIGRASCRDRVCT